MPVINLQLNGEILNSKKETKSVCYLIFKIKKIENASLKDLNLEAKSLTSL